MNQKYYLWQEEEEDGLVHLVLDSLDTFSVHVITRDMHVYVLSERMNVLHCTAVTIYLPCRRKFGIASNLRVHM